MKKVGKIISLCSIGVILGALVAGNIYGVMYAPMITTFLFGTGERNGGTEEQARSDELCQKIAEEGIVLLKNQDNALPLETKDLNVFGWSSTDQGFLLSGIGSGSSTISDEKKVSLLSGLEKDGFNINQDLVKFYNDYDSSTFSFATGNSKRMNLIEPSISEYSDELIDGARNFSDTALVVISRVAGENVGEIPTTQKKSHGQAEDKTRNYLHISKEEEQLLNMVEDNFDNVVVIINSTNAMELGFLNDANIDAALNVGATGQSGALAIGKVLDGTVNPSGHLTDTFAYDYTKEPSFQNYIRNGNNIQYLENIYFGYKWYETADVQGYFNRESNEYGDGYEAMVQYPFGYGLSYTTFKWKLTNSSIKDAATIDKDAQIELTFSCTNTGDVAGKDVMEIFYTAPYINNEIEKSAVNLIDFIKTDTIEPGETESDLTVTLDLYDMASFDSYDKNNNGKTTWELDVGDYQIKFMDDSHNLKKMNQNVLNFKLASTITYDTDPVTGTEVTDLFTGDDAYSGVPLDGSTAYKNPLPYLSRSDFNTTFPTASGDVISSEISKANNYTATEYEQTEMPVTDTVDGEPLLLVTKESGSKATEAELKGEGNASLVYNKELLTTIGNNYDAPELDQLINQMNTTELAKLVEDSGFQTKAIESIGKPKLDEFDGPAGFNTTTQTGDKNTGTWTAFPNETLLGQTWSKAIANAMGINMAQEGQATNLSGWYAPGVNLHRTTFNARNYEYYSEDPVLSGFMAANVIEGAKANGLHCYLKHFSLSEPGVNARNLNTWLTEQNYRENYLKPFEIAVKKGGANAIMSAFNSVGGVWAGANYAQNVQILRNEWGFRGTVITDWSDGSGNMNCQMGIRAGNDMWLNPNDGHNSSKLDMSNPTNVYCAKIAAKNIVYTFANTYAYADQKGNAKDSADITAGASVSKVYWIFAGIDAFFAIGLGVWAFFVFWNPKKKIVE